LPFIPCPLVAETALNYQMEGQQCKTVLHWVQDGLAEWDDLNLIALCNSINTAWVADLQSVFTPNVTFLGTSARALYAVDGPAVEVPEPEGVAGEQPGDAVPNNVAWAIKKAGTMAGRAHRGRIYHFGFSQGSLLDSGHVTVPSAGVYLAAYNSFIGSVADDGPPKKLVVVSRYHGVDNVIIDGRYARRPHPRAEGIYTIIDSLTYTDTALDSQRRRLPGRGI
jgi:hypothetical protein